MHRQSRLRLSDCGKSRSLDSSELFPSNERIIELPPRLPEEVINDNSNGRDVAIDTVDLSPEAAQNELNLRKEEAMDGESMSRFNEQIFCQQQLPDRLRKLSERPCLSPIK